MACPEVTIQTILGTECIGDSLPKIMGNFNTLGDAACDLITKVTNLSAQPFNIADTTTIDLIWNSTSRTLSATTSVTPVGSVVAFPATSAPSGWLKLNGASLNRTDYPELWSFAQASGNIVTEAVWTATNTGSFSTGNLSTTFRIPDLRGEFVRGWDDSRGVDSGRGIGVWQTDAIRTPTTSNSGNFQTFFASTSRTGDIVNNGIDAIGGMSGVVGGAAAYFQDNFTSSIARAGFPSYASETRPRNTSLLYCIKF